MANLTVFGDVSVNAYLTTIVDVNFNLATFADVIANLASFADVTVTSNYTTIVDLTVPEVLTSQIHVCLLMLFAKIKILSDKAQHYTALQRPEKLSTCPTNT